MRAAGKPLSAPRRMLDRALSAVGLQRTIPARSGGRPTAGRRVYHAAVIDRLTIDLFAEALSANDELKGDLQRLRGLSRRLARDTAYGSRLPNIVCEQVLGADGIRLQSRVEKRVGGLNRGVNKTLEDAWRRWGKRETCSLDRSLSWPDVQHLVLRTIVVDGECLVRVVKGAPNAWGFAVQVIDIDLLDHTFTGRWSNGNEVVMGVEIDRYGGPVAYHLWTRHPSEVGGDRSRVRVPVSELRHLFDPKRAGQRRGIPWSSAILLDANTLAAFLEAAVHAARIGASRMASIERDKDVEMGDEDDPYQSSPIPEEVAPGQILDLEPGSRLNSIDWQYPTGEIDPFTRIILRSLAVGQNVSYASLSGDLSQANYSSLRAGMLPERDTWKKLQRMMIEQLCEPIYREWREFAVIAGEIPARVDMRDYDDVLFQPRGWPWVDPKKDLEAQELALTNKLTTRRRILAEQGLDLEEVLEELAEEEALIKKLGLAPAPAKKPKPGAPAADDESTDDTADADKPDENGDRAHSIRVLA